MVAHNKAMEKRKRETKFVSKYLRGDFNVYHEIKRLQEEAKRLRQRNMEFSWALKRYCSHMKRYPTWFDVNDATESYVKNLYYWDANDDRLTNAAQDTRNFIDASGKDFMNLVKSKYFIDASGKDFMNLFKEILLNFDVGNVFVNTNSGKDSSVSPTKMFVFKHANGNLPIVEFVKHQPRLVEDHRFKDVIGIADDIHEDGSFAIITDTLEYHRRYLHPGYSDIYFNDIVQPSNAFRPMRVCFNIFPDTFKSFQFTTSKGCLMEVERVDKTVETAHKCCLAVLRDMTKYQKMVRNPPPSN